MDGDGDLPLGSASGAHQKINPMTYRPEIDGLRALAVLAVIVFHAKANLLPGGYLGVDVFFVISGYLITKILLRNNLAVQTNLITFYERRIRRIAPAFFVVMSASIIAAWFLMPTLQIKDFGRSLVAAAAFSSNIWFSRSSGYFDVGAEERPLLHTWSLGVEEQFYLVYPLLLYWAHGRSERLVRLLVLSGLAGSFALYLMRWEAHPIDTFYLLPTRAWELLTGAVVALWSPRGLNRIKRLYAEFPALLALASLLTVLVIPTPQAQTSPWYQVAAVVFTALILSLTQRQVYATRILAWRPLVALGLLSYSAYLWHLPVFAVGRMLSINPLGADIVIALVCTTFLLSACTWRWIERPARRLDFGSRRTVFVSMGIGTFMVALIGAGLAWSNWIHRLRLSPEILELETAIQEESDDRQRAIFSGTCSFDGQHGRYRVFSEFISAWDCWGSTTPRTVVVGDSHAADIAMSLRSIGWDIGQMTGAGCSIVPSQMAETCRQQFDFIRRNAAAKGLNVLVLGNRFRPSELTEESRREIEDYWFWPGVKIWFFTGLPETTNLASLRPRATMHSLDINSLQLDEAGSLPSEHFAELLARDKPDLRVFNSRKLICGIDQEAACTWHTHGKVLLIDGQHLTVEGAVLFGRRIAEMTGTLVERSYSRLE